LGVGEFLKLILVFNFIVEIYKKRSLDTASEIVTFRQLKLSQTEMANNTGYPVALLFGRTFAEDFFLFVHVRMKWIHNDIQNYVNGCSV
jgi:hypothetical protein